MLDLIPYKAMPNALQGYTLRLITHDNILPKYKCRALKRRVS